MNPENMNPVTTPADPISDLSSDTPYQNSGGDMDIKSIFSRIAEQIIERQEAIIGPVAIEQARQIPELVINWPQHDVKVTGDLKAAIDELVEQYKVLFGQISVEVSKEAVSQILAKLPPDQLPNSLK